MHETFPEEAQVLSYHEFCIVNILIHSSTLYSNVNSIDYRNGIKTATMTETCKFVEISVFL